MDVAAVYARCQEAIREDKRKQELEEAAEGTHRPMKSRKKVSRDKDLRKSLGQLSVQRRRNA